MLQRMRRIFQNTQGLALIEFAFVLPIFIILVLFTAEFSRFFLMHLRVQKTAYTMANIITQYTPASATPANAGQLNSDIISTTLGMTQLKKMIGGDADNENVSMVVTSVRNEVTTYSKKGLVAKWQTCVSGSGGCPVKSVVTKSNVLVPASFVKNTKTNFASPYNGMVTNMRDGENMVSVEVSYRYKPYYTALFVGLGTVFPDFNFPGISQQIFTSVAFFSPRDLGPTNGGMACLPPSDTSTGKNTYFSYQDCPCASASYAAGCSSLPL